MTSSERALVPGSSGGLPAYIERRTRIANRVLGELERRDTEAFFRRHPRFFQWVVSRYYPMDESLIDRHAERWDWGFLIWNTALPWSEALIDRHAERWDWRALSWNAALPWSEALIDRFADRWDWGYGDIIRGCGGLSGNAGLPWREALIDRPVRQPRRWEC